jgi:hypothetical protein
MKTAKHLLAALFLLGITHSHAQVNINIGIPAWGVPVTTERYYYIPDLETYYDIPSREYIYIHDGRWVRTATLPVVYRHYDLYGGRKVIINDYHGNAPYAYYNVHKVKYIKAGKPHKVWVNKHGHGNGNGHGNGHGNGRGHHK